MIDKNRILEIFEQAGVLLKGHFSLTSGRHSDKYLQCAKIFKNYKYSEELCSDLSKKFESDKIDFVIGPAIGAIQMCYEVSRHLDTDNIFAERENGQMTLRRGFGIVKNARYLIVEDVITTGKSVLEVKEIVEKNGGIVAGIGSVVDRTRGKINFGVKYESLIEFDIESYLPQDCPLCQEGKIDIVKPGSRPIDNKGI